MTPKSVMLMANYNRWMNDRLHAACEQLSHQELLQDKGAFFGSILGTLNHIAVGDTIWLHRFSTLPGGFKSLRQLCTYPHPTSLSETLASDLPTWRAYRTRLDELILHWTNEITETQLITPLTTTNMHGISATRMLGPLLQHFFNHQTHHRGQVSTLLFQVGVDVGETDLLSLIPDMA